MSRSRTVGAMAGLLSSFCAGAASADQLKGGELRTLLAGRTIYLTAPFGALPISYSPAGSMVAKSIAMAAFYGVYKDTGNWRVSGDRFCQKWNTWNGGKEQCFTVTRKNGKLHWRSDDGMSGTAYPAE